MNTELFRKSSIDRVNSPEQLNEYIRVSNPGVWLILAAVVALLAGVVIWGVFGVIDTTVDTAVVVGDGRAVCYVSSEDAARIKPGMAVAADGVTGAVESVADVPVQIDDEFADYTLYLTGFARGEFCYAVTLALPGLSDGVCAATITIDSVRPISFVIH